MLNFNTTCGQLGQNIIIGRVPPMQPVGQAEGVVSCVTHVRKRMMISTQKPQKQQPDNTEWTGMFPRKLLQSHMTQENCDQKLLRNFPLCP